MKLTKTVGYLCSPLQGYRVIVSYVFVYYVFPMKWGDILFVCLSVRLSEIRVRSVINEPLAEPPFQTYRSMAKVILRGQRSNGHFCVRSVSAGPLKDFWITLRGSVHHIKTTCRTHVSAMWVPSQGQTFVSLTYHAADSVPHRSDSKVVQADLELHCLHMAYSLAGSELTTKICSN